MAATYPNDTYFDLRPSSAPEDYGKIFNLLKNVVYFVVYKYVLQILTWHSALKLEKKV